MFTWFLPVTSYKNMQSAASRITLLKIVMSKTSLPARIVSPKRVRTDSATESHAAMSNGGLQGAKSNAKFHARYSNYGISNRFDDSGVASVNSIVEERPSADAQLLAVRSSLKLNHMRMIAAIDLNGNLSAAAAAMNISQPAASRMVAEMEAIVDAPLIDRHARGVTLTPYGMALARRARSILIELNQVGQDMADLRTGRGGTVHLGAVTAPAVELAVPAIQEMRQRFPRLDVTIQVEASPVLARELLAARHDFIIARVPEDLNPRLFEGRVIGIEKGSLLVRRGHPLLSGALPVTLEATRNFEWVLQPSGALLRRTVEQQFLRRDVALPERILSTSSMLLTLVMLTRSDAISAVSNEVARFLNSPTGLDGAVELLPLDFDIEVQPYSLITAVNRTLSPAAQLLYDAILHKLR
jgi:DNA-binding transcriptional LysR family regulator